MFTIEEIKAIFNAGITQGEDIAVSRDWGNRPSQTDDKVFFEAVREVLIARQKDYWVDDEVVEALIGLKPL